MASNIERWLRRAVTGACVAALYVACGGARFDSDRDSQAGAPGSAGAGDAAGAPASGCSVTAPCESGAERGVCVDGGCVPCREPDDDAACVTAYGKHSLCIAGACATADCRVDRDCHGGALCIDNHCASCQRDSDCTAPNTVCNVTEGSCVTNRSCETVASGDACPVNPNDLCCAPESICAAAECCGVGPCQTKGSAKTDGTCQSGKCVLAGCLPATGSSRYVDFDAKPGGSGSKTCPYGAVESALDDLAAGGGTILVRGSTGMVPATLTIGPGLNLIGADPDFGPCTVKTCSEPNDWPVLQTGDYRAINFSTAGVRSLRFLRIQGTTKAATTAGVFVSAATLNLDHVAIGGYQFSLYVTTGASVKIGNGVRLHESHEGLKLTDNGSAAGGTVEVATGDGADPISFSDNDYGIMCNGTSKLSVSGPGSGASSPGLIRVANNALAGIYWNATQAAPVGVLDGVEIDHNGTDDSAAYHGGIIVFSQSAMQLRNSYVHDNSGNGVMVVASGPPTATGLSQIDLGAGIGGSAGRNTFVKNELAGLCVQSALAMAAKSASLRAEGNIFGSSAAGDCIKGGKYSQGASCAPGVDVSMACTSAVSLSTCTASNSCQ